MGIIFIIFRVDGHNRRRLPLHHLASQRPGLIRRNPISLSFPGSKFHHTIASILLVIDAGLVGSTNFCSSHPQWHEPEHRAFSPDGKHQLAEAHLPLDGRMWRMPHGRTPERPGVTGRVKCAKCARASRAHCTRPRARPHESRNHSETRG